MGRKVESRSKREKKKQKGRDKMGKKKLRGCKNVVAFRKIDIT